MSEREKSYCISLMAAAVVRGGGRVAVMLPSRILVNQMHALFMSLMPELGPAVLDDERDQVETTRPGYGLAPPACCSRAGKAVGSPGGRRAAEVQRPAA